MASASSDSPVVSSTSTFIVRAFSWGMLFVLLVFLINNYLNVGMGWPGAKSLFEGEANGLAWVQIALYAAAIIGAFLYVSRTTSRTLRVDSAAIARFNGFLVRAAFWAVFLVGLADAAISFLRVEGMLEQYVSAQMASDLGRAQFRGPFIHLPLMLLGVVIAALTRSLGFIWLTLLIVVAELTIVFTRFIFSYEQAFMADLVRFWYAALFLFASAYTLQEEGHVRVDVFYAGFKDKTKGFINAVGSLCLGMLVCWVILIEGLSGRSSVINSPMLSYEISQSGFGMYTKYLMAGFLAVFAITMMVQFVSYLLESVADYRDEPGRRALPEAPPH
ncbi:MAG: TRAP transporter small permease subunit [Burkholderiaceae bacterium]